MAATERRPRAMLHMLAVVRAAAEARRDLRWMAHFAQRRFEFRLLAAATREIPQLPAEGWHDLQRQIKVQAQALGAELRLSIQAEGYEALRRVAGRGGRLKSQDGTLDVHFRFDQSGRAFAALKSSDQVQRSLAHFHLMLDESDEG